MDASTVAAIIPAAGKGSRMGSNRNKIWINLGVKPVIYYSLKVFEDHPAIGRVVLVVSSSELSTAMHLVQEEHFEKTMVTEGGERRRDSVYRGLLCLDPHIQWVIVHDGARPLLAPDMVDCVLEAAVQHKAALCAIPVTDTLKKIDAEGYVTNTVERNELYHAQTPQAFARDLLIRGHKAIEGEQPDDASLVEEMGVKVKVVLGSPDNIKITRVEDLRLAKMILNARTCPAGGR